MKHSTMKMLLSDVNYNFNINEIPPLSVFVSHSTCDEEFIARFALGLRQMGISVWLNSMLVGDSLRRKIEEGIESCDYFVIVISDNSIKSSWVQLELDMGFINELESKRVIVLPIRIDQAKMPLSLRTKLYVDFGKDYDVGFEKLLQRLFTPSAPSQEGKIIASLSIRLTHHDSIQRLSAAHGLLLEMWM